MGAGKKALLWIAGLLIVFLVATGGAYLLTSFKNLPWKEQVKAPSDPVAEAIHRLEVKVRFGLRHNFQAVNGLCYWI